MQSSASFYIDLRFPVSPVGKAVVQFHYKYEFSVDPNQMASTEAS